MPVGSSQSTAVFSVEPMAEAPYTAEAQSSDLASATSAVETDRELKPRITPDPSQEAIWARPPMVSAATLLHSSESLAPSGSTPMGTLDTQEYPLEWTIVLEKSYGHKLGINIAPPSYLMDSLLILEILLSGAFPDWNHVMKVSDPVDVSTTASEREGMLVRPGDKIISANSVSGDPHTIRDALADASDAVQVSLRRDQHPKSWRKPPSKLLHAREAEAQQTANVPHSPSGNPTQVSVAPASPATDASSATRDTDVDAPRDAPSLTLAREPPVVLPPTPPDTADPAPSPSESVPTEAEAAPEQVPQHSSAPMDADPSFLAPEPPAIIPASRK